MKTFVIAGTLVTALAVGATAFAQATPPAAKQPATGATKQAPPPPPKAAAGTAEKPAQPVDKPVAKKRAASAGSNADASHTAP
jgi:hypothetical protein